MPFALPVDGCLVFAVQDGPKMFNVLFVSIFNSEVIDNEGEGHVACAVLVQPIGVGFAATMFAQKSAQVVVG